MVSKKMLKSVQNWNSVLDLCIILSHIFFPYFFSWFALQSLKILQANLSCHQLKSTEKLFRENYAKNYEQSTGWVKRIWTILWGCLEVTGWLKIKNFNSSKKFMKKSSKVNKSYFFDIKHGLTMTFWIFFSKSKNYAIPMYGLQYP